jgi:hypothetical protein
MFALLVSFAVVSADPSTSLEAKPGVMLGFGAVPLEAIRAEWTKNKILLPTQGGVIVSKIYDDSPAEKTELNIGDVVVRVNGRAVVNKDLYLKARAACKAGESVKLEFLRYQRTVRGKRQVVTWQRHKTELVAVEDDPKKELKPACPLRIKSVAFGMNVIGEVTMGVEVESRGDSVTAFETAADCRDGFGRPVGAWGLDDGQHEGLCQHAVSPGENYTAEWALHGRDATKEATVRISHVKLGDGTEWVRPKASKAGEYEAKAPK